MNTITIDVRSLSDTLADVATAMKTRRASGPRYSFDSLDLLWSTLTARRWELLKTIAGQGPLSIREVARRVGKDVKGVHADVQALLACGLLTKTESGVEFPFDAIHVDFMLKAA